MPSIDRPRFLANNAWDVLRHAMKLARVPQRTLARAILSSARDGLIPPCPNLVIESSTPAGASSDDEMVAKIERRLSESLASRVMLRAASQPRRYSAADQKRCSSHHLR